MKNYLKYQIAKLLYTKAECFSLALDNCSLKSTHEKFLAHSQKIDRKKTESRYSPKQEKLIRCKIPLDLESETNNIQIAVLENLCSYYSYSVLKEKTWFNSPSAIIY
jgi:hypothetical protein